MNLNDWLAEEKGRAASLAEFFEITPSAVTQWRSNGVPLGRMRDVREFTAGAVTLEEMVPQPAAEITSGLGALSGSVTRRVA